MLCNYEYLSVLLVEELWIVAIEAFRSGRLAFAPVMNAIRMVMVPSSPATESACTAAISTSGARSTTCR